jgi:SAM-dependent methyltransferase/uncharacterized protein YbaR (Trm112 family)
MRASLLPLLRCPRCRADASLAMTARASDAREVREGELVCERCRQTFAIEGGIANLLHEPPEFVVREAAGLDRFANVMRADGWDRERILALPDAPLAYWCAQSTAMRYILAATDFEPGQRLLDVGSNTCWASNIFARRGLHVVALDIATAELQGLRTADYFLETGDVYFERLLSVMFDPALASASMDYVFCCEVLHHNDPEHLRRTLRECFRVLRPGGRLFIVNEPMRFVLRPKLDHAEEVADFEGNEHVYFLHQYVLAARAAGFRVAAPWLRGIDRDSRRWPATHRLAPLEDALRRRAAGRALIDAKRIARYTWRHLLAGDRSLCLDCVKPA